MLHEKLRDIFDDPPEDADYQAIVQNAKNAGGRPHAFEEKQKAYWKQVVKNL